MKTLLISVCGVMTGLAVSCSPVSYTITEGENYCQITDQNGDGFRLYQDPSDDNLNRCRLVWWKVEDGRVFYKAKVQQ